MLTSLKNHINEKLVISKEFEDPFKNNPELQPKTKRELIEVLRKRLQEQNGGTEKNPINLNDIDISRLDDLREVFPSAEIYKKSFKFIDVSDWDVSNISNFSYLFGDCTKLKYIGDISKWKPRRAKTFNKMFLNCKKLTNIGDLSDWTVKNVLNFSSMFQNCENLEPVGIEHWEPDINEQIGADAVKLIISGTSGWKIPEWVKEVKRRG